MFQVNCPPSDPFYCGTHVLPADCERYINVPHMCPHMCRICGECVEAIERENGGERGEEKGRERGREREGEGGRRRVR